ncbi:MAG: cytochrome c oxidase assembly factor Coa1 family protein [Acidobacteriota bacterium]|nr:cytochrome c oxidase assembly factor Coa1 family protein [Acidobacteriota bacterium]
MTPKRIALIVGGVLAVVVLLVALFAGAIVSVALYAVGHSDAAETAKNFLRSNEKLKADVGEVKDFGWLVTGNTVANSADGNASLNFKVIGEKRNVNASVHLFYKEGKAWRVAGATYQNGSGRTVELLDKYESDDASAPVESPVESDNE